MANKPLSVLKNMPLGQSHSCSRDDVHPKGSTACLMEWSGEKKATRVVMRWSSPGYVTVETSHWWHLRPKLFTDWTTTVKLDYLPIEAAQQEMAVLLTTWACAD